MEILNERLACYVLYYTCYFTGAQDEQGSPRIFFVSRSEFLEQLKETHLRVFPAPLFTTEKNKCCCKELQVTNQDTERNG